MFTGSARLKLSLFLLFLSLGLLLCVKLTNEGYASYYLEQQDQNDLLTIWSDLERKQDSLEEELEARREQKMVLSQEVSAGSTALNNIKTQRDTLYQVNGMVPVKGPGVEVVFSGDTPLLYLDLVDIVNELWASGAEAISINQERVIASTSFYFTETDSGIYLTANGDILEYPISIKAVGNANMLEKGLTFPGGIVDNLSTLYNIKPDIIKSAELELPSQKKSPLDIIPGWIGGSRTFFREIRQ